MTRTTIWALLLLTVTTIAGLGAAQDQPPAEGRVLSAGELLTNDSIVRLTHAEISQETIIRMVHTRPGKYALGAEDIIALKDAGVSDQVLDAMLDHSALGCDPAMIVPMEILLSPPAAGNAPQPQPKLQPGQSGSTPTPQSDSGTKSAGQSGGNPATRASQALVYHYGTSPKKASQNLQH